MTTAQISFFETPRKIGIFMIQKYTDWFKIGSAVEFYDYDEHGEPAGTILINNMVAHEQFSFFRPSIIGAEIIGENGFRITREIRRYSPCSAEDAIKNLVEQLDRVELMEGL